MKLKGIVYSLQTAGVHGASKHHIKVPLCLPSHAICMKLSCSFVRDCGKDIIHL